MCVSECAVSYNTLKSMYEREGERWRERGREKKREGESLHVGWPAPAPTFHVELDIHNLHSNTGVQNTAIHPRHIRFNISFKSHTLVIHR